jgi:hypothetical protein
MTTATREKIIGDPVDRVDGPLKVTGAVPYPSDFTVCCRNSRGSSARACLSSVGRDVFDLRSPGRVSRRATPSAVGETSARAPTTPASRAVTIGAWTTTTT